MLEIYKFPVNFLPFWHIGARMGVGPFVKFLGKARAENMQRILDIGSGGGWNSLLAGYMGFTVTCVDLSKASLENVGQTADFLSIRHKLSMAVGNSYKLPFLDESFDIVIASHIIEHLDEPSDMLVEIRRVLKKGGVLMLSCPSLNHWMRVSRWLGVNLDPLDHKVLGYGEGEIKSQLPIGMMTEKITYSGRFVESNFMDVQNVLSRLTGVKANPASMNKPGATKKQKKSSMKLVNILFYLKEIIILLAMGLCKIEDTAFFFIKGSMISMEIKKVE